MARRSQANWQALIQAHASSGLTAAAFCRQHGVNPKSFSFRRRQLGTTAVAPRSPIVAMKLSGGSRAEVLRLHVGSSTMLELSPGVDVVWLTGLLRALKD